MFDFLDLLIEEVRKEIYASRFVDAVNIALAGINQKVALKNKMDILGENKESL